MALNEQEQQIVEHGKNAGKSENQIFAALAKYRQSQIPIKEKIKKPLSQKITEGAETVTDFLGLENATGVFGDLLARQGIGTDVPKEVTQEFIEAPSRKEVTGAVLQTASIPAGFALTGGGSLAGQVAVGAGLGYLYDVGSDLAADESLQEAATPGAGTLVGAAVPPVLRGGGALIGAGARGVSSVAKNMPGVTQTVTETAERLPRALGKVGTSIQESTERAAKMKTATPAVREAMKSNLDEVIIDAVAQADAPTKNAYKKMVELAEAPRTSLRPATRPESVAGEAAAEQFDMVVGRRKEVGQKIGEISDNLSQTERIDAVPVQRAARDILRQNGIIPEQGGVLRFDNKSITPQQQEVVQKLYNLATNEGTLTPKQIYQYDQLFSKLQREARFIDNVDDIFVQVPTEQGTKDVNIFKVFRDVFSQQLDEVSPEMRQLNREYRVYRNLQDDLERTIFKSGNYDSTNIGAENFAQTNLRRLFSDAQSAADYRALYDKLDATSRSLGYEGARADDLAGFALRLRDIYPEVTPETSFRGGISGGVKDVVGQLSEVGTPDTVDRQKALRKLLEETTID